MVDTAVPPVLIERARVSLSEIDRRLLDQCLAGAPRAWEDFVDRFLGLVVHVATHTAEARGKTPQTDTVEDLVSEVFSVVIANDFAVLRRFQRNCSLATYLCVIARRVAVRCLMADHFPAAGDEQLDTQGREDREINRLEDVEEVNRLLLRLDPDEARVVRMYHLEGMTYRQISEAVGMNENSIGPVLTRARAKLRLEE